MHGLYKSCLIEKLSKHICFIKYKSSPFTFEKPFVMADDRELLELFRSPTVKLTDCVTNKTVDMFFDDVIMFHIDHEEDPEQSKASLKKTLEEFQNIFSQFTFLRGQRLQSMFFRTDIEERLKDRIRNLKILDHLKKDDLDDYDRLLANELSIVSELRALWYSWILERYKSTIKSMDEEIAAGADQSIIDELQSIKDILSTIPKEAEDELAKRNTVVDILNYWPTLLLPRSTVLDL